VRMLRIFPGLKSETRASQFLTSWGCVVLSRAFGPEFDGWRPLGEDKRRNFSRR
jgi:hypothetical protein